METSRYLLVVEERNAAVAAFAAALGESAEELPDEGYGIQTAPFIKTLHFEEVLVWANDGQYFAVSVVIRDGNSEAIACWPIGTGALARGTVFFQSMLRMLRSVPNNGFDAPTQQPFQRPTKNEEILREPAHDTAFISLQVAQAAAHVLEADPPPKHSYVVVYDWREAKDLIEHFRPWRSTSSGEFWWERRRVNHVHLFSPLENRGQITGAHLQTMTVVASSVTLQKTVKPKDLPSWAGPTTNALLLEEPTDPSVADLLRLVPQPAVESRPFTVLEYIRDITLPER